MTTATDSAVKACLEELATFRYDSADPVEPVTLAHGPATGRLLRALGAQPIDMHAAVACTLASGLAELPDPMAAAILAYQLGAMVQDGLDPAPLAEALRRRLPADLAAARRFVTLLDAAGYASPEEADDATRAHIGRQEPRGASAWAALEVSTPAAMAVWCRHRPSRLAARAVPGFAEDARWLGERGGYCAYIGELFSAADGTRLTVLAPEQLRGFIVELELVRNAAHLFALLEDVLVGDPKHGLLAGPCTDPAIAALARGEAPLTQDLEFDIGWHYEYWWGLRPAAAAHVSGVHPLVAAMIGVEATVHDLPEFRGRPVVLMSSARLGQRRCDASFFAPLHDALRSRVTVVQSLSPTEVGTLCDELCREAEAIGDDG